METHPIAPRGLAGPSRCKAIQADEDSITLQALPETRGSYQVIEGLQVQPVLQAEVSRQQARRQGLCQVDCLGNIPSHQIMGYGAPRCTFACRTI